MEVKLVFGSNNMDHVTKSCLVSQTLIENSLCRSCYIFNCTHIKCIFVLCSL